MSKLSFGSEKPPKQVLLEKYRHYLQMILTESDEESVLQQYLVAVTRAYDPHSEYMSPLRRNMLRIMVPARTGSFFPCVCM